VHGIIHTPYLRKPPYCHILSLSIGDIIQTLIVMPLNVYLNLAGVNSAGCKFWIVMVCFHTLISIFSHVAIIIDRYFAITCTITYQIDVRYCTKAV
jgi:hypothetical protein